ncbi:MAG: PEP-CTERM sorting domain-containing protein [Fimbriimonadia bacterium]
MDLRTNLADVWLSTPVPEPSGALGLGLLLICIAYRRCSRR